MGTGGKHIPQNQNGQYYINCGLGLQCRIFMIAEEKIIV